MTIVHGVRTLWWFFGFSSPGKASPSPEEDKSSPSARQWRLGRKRLGRTTRLLLAILPRPLQRALGYPVCTRIGCSVSPEVRCSPTKPCGKGSKRKQDDMDEDEELEQQSWVEALNQELTDEDQSVDPDYEPSAIETDSEEYRSHNDTESDLEVEKGVVVIQDLETIQTCLINPDAGPPLVTWWCSLLLGTDLRGQPVTHGTAVDRTAWRHIVTELLLHL
ncbi:hypothetical protein QTP70_004545 [Hemibagrus guttatus]|uniref:Oogenesis-related gene n=1 Tax=Hemibagrus guttatus TaxID=175788 RepID=A0AAE0QUK9_9TELE|nr:hypothetical protein QTP70_004545 [Hemibagrus guttatus]